MEIVNPSAVGIDPARLDLISPAMQRYCDQGLTSGIITLAARNGKIFHTGNWGLQNIETNTPMAFDSILRFYSMTKPIVSVALMMLHEEGKFHLDDPISKVIPDFENQEVLNVDGSREKAEPITFWHVLTHTAGLTYGWNPDHPAEKMYRDSDLFNRDITLKQMIEKIAQLPLRFQPGAKWNYSVATDVVGYLVEAISGMPLGDFLQERIFNPLGMVDTSFEIPDEKLHRLATLYGSVQPGDPYMKVIDAPETSSYRPPVTNHRGGGGLLSTAGDYIKFAQMIANGGTFEGKRYLGRNTVELMTMNHLPEHMFPLGVNPFPGYGFGLGFTQVTNVPDTRISGSLGSHGWSGMADTHFWIDPVEKMIGIVLLQYVPSQTVGARDDFNNFLYQALI
jgi:CubicO group peptidase (beta-lactamase class C family)